MARAATSNLDHCDRVIEELGHLAKGVDLSSTELKQADGRVAKLLEMSEGLIVLIADSGVETADAPLIRVVTDTAKQISDAFEAAVARGEITVDQLMDEKYREIAGTDPKQYLTDYVAFTDRVLPSIQDPIQKSDPRIVFCVAWAKGGYLPTHNPNYRLPQGPDPVWNNANCRNRRLFNDRAVKKVAANTKPFLLQTYRRDMGGGNFVLMKDCHRRSSSVAATGARSGWVSGRTRRRSVATRSACGPAAIPSALSQARRQLEPLVLARQQRLQRRHVRRRIPGRHWVIVRLDEVGGVPGSL